MPQPVTDRKAIFDKCWQHLHTVPGCIVEFGVYDGGNTTYLAGLGRTVWAFDTFEGMPLADYEASLDYANMPGKFVPTHPVLAYLIDIGVKPVVGRFADTLPGLETGPIALAFVDCDYYASHKQALDYILPRLSLGGCMVFDDYLGLDGATKAIDEYGLSVDLEGVSWPNSK